MFINHESISSIRLLMANSVLAQGARTASGLYSLFVIRLAIDVSVVSCKKYNEMQGGKPFRDSAPLFSESLGLAGTGVSLLSQSNEAFKLDVPELTAI